jgi:hypothetical protein
LLYRGLTAPPFGNGAVGLDEGVSHQGLLPAVLAGNLLPMLLPAMICLLVLAGWLR